MRGCSRAAPRCALSLGSTATISGHLQYPSRAPFGIWASTNGQWAQQKAGRASPGPTHWSTWGLVYGNRNPNKRKRNGIAMYEQSIWAWVKRCGRLQRVVVFFHWHVCARFLMHISEQVPFMSPIHRSIGAALCSVGVHIGHAPLLTHPHSCTAIPPPPLQPTARVKCRSGPKPHPLRTPWGGACSLPTQWTFENVPPLLCSSNALSLLRTSNTPPPYPKEPKKAAPPQHAHRVGWAYVGSHHRDTLLRIPLPGTVLSG